MLFFYRKTINAIYNRWNNIFTDVCNHMITESITTKVVLFKGAFSILYRISNSERFKFYFVPNRYEATRKLSK